MRIDKTNSDVIRSRDVSLHDDMLMEFHFHRIARELVLPLQKYGGEIYTIRFTHVLGFEMTSCNFWGPSRRIFDFELLEGEEQKLLPRLWKMREEKKPVGTTTPEDGLGEKENYIETVITFVSGDQLQVVCEAIDIGDPYSEEKLDDD